MELTRRSLLVAALTMAVLAGCGDAGVEAGGDTADPGAQETAAASLALEQWQERLQDVCVRADQELIGVDPLDQDAWSSALVDSLEIRLDGLRSLPRPAGYEAEVEALLGQLDDVVAIHEESGAAAAIEELVDPDGATAVEVERLIAELGIEDCGEAAAADTICARTPPDLVAVVLGQAPEPEPAAQLGAQGCSWEVGDDRLAVQTGPLDVYPQALDFIRSAGRPVAGIGDEAYVVEGYSSVTGGSTRGSTLWVVAGDDVYGVGAIVAGEAVDDDTLRSVAAGLLAGG